MSHTPRRNSQQNSPQPGISRKGSRQLHREREINRSRLHALHLGTHAPSGRRCGRHDDCHRPTPSNAPRPPQRPDIKGIRHVIDSAPHTRFRTTPVVLRPSSKLWTRPRDGIDRVVLSCVENQNTQGSRNESEDSKRDNNAGDTTWRLPSTRDERPGRASFRAKTRVSTGVEAGTNCGVRSHRAKRFLPAQESSACKQSAALTERACDTPRDATRVFKARARMDSFHMVMARQTTRIRRIRPRRWRLKRRACDDVCVG